MSVSSTNFSIINGNALDVLRSMASESVQCCVTSPPYYGLRDYGIEGQIGLETSPSDFIAKLVALFDEVHRVLKPNGTVWLNLGDSYWTDSPVRSTSAEAFSKTWDTSQTASNGGNRKTAARFGSFKNKDLMMMPHRVAIALQDVGWYVRQDIVWSKPNPMPESVTDRCTKAHEYIFLLTKSPKYYFDAEAIREDQVSNRPDMALKGVRTGLAYLQQGPLASNHNKGRDRSNGNRNGLGASTLDRPRQRKPAGWDTGAGSHGTVHREGRAPEVEYTAIEKAGRNKRSVWTVATEPMPDAHFATFPQKLIEPCILAGSKEGDLVLDPFSGAGTTGLVSLKHRRNFVGIELNPDYINIAEKRLAEVQVKLFA